MESFKCCGKDFKNYICIVCYRVFHPSCLERDIKTSVKINGKLIYCSTNCQNVDEEKETKEQNYISEIKNLRNMLEEKDRHIVRLKRGTESFEEIVEEAENKLLEELSKQKKELDLLKYKLLTIQEENEEHIASLNEKERTILELKTEIEELHQLSRNMVTSIDMLEKDNKRYLYKMKQTEIQNENVITELKQEISNLRKSNEIIEEELNFNINETNYVRLPKNPKEKLKQNGQNKRKVLILCDQTGRHVGNLLRPHLSDYQLQIIIKPNAFLIDVIKEIHNLTKDFTLNDYVIVMAGYNDFIKYKYPSIRNIHENIRSCTHTNIIFSSIHYSVNTNLNDRIYDFNKKLNTYSIKINNFAEGNILYMEINTQNSLYPNKYKITNKIMIFLKVAMNNYKKNYGNLVFIKTTNNNENTFLEQTQEVIVIN